MKFWQQKNWRQYSRGRKDMKKNGNPSVNWEYKFIFLNNSKKDPPLSPLTGGI